MKMLLTTCQHHGFNPRNIPEGASRSIAVAAKVAGLLVAIFLLLAVRTAYAEERSFEIGEVNIQARVDRDGNMQVTETDTYHFAGAFNGILVELNGSGSDGIAGFQAFEVSDQQDIPVRSELFEEGDKLQFRVYSQSADETKVFRFTYSVRNVVQVYADTAELYWKFFDQSNPSTLGNVHIEIELPGGVEPAEITAFGHGPSHGAVEVGDNGVVRYRIDPLPAEEMLEVRVLFPVSAVPGSVKINDVPMREQILEQERNWGYHGDDRSVFGALALLLANLAAGFLVYRKFGKAHKVEWKDKYYRDLPSDVTPAVVSYLMDFRVKPGDLIATLIDLVRKQRVYMEATPASKGRHDRYNYTFRLLDRRTEGLQPHETLLLDLFFPPKRPKNEQESDKELSSGYNVVSLADFRRQIKEGEGASDFLQQWTNWKAAVVKAAERLGYVEKTKRVGRWLILAALVQFFGLWFLAPSAWNWLMFCSIPLVFFRPKKQYRTKLGELEYRKWQAFKRYLQDFTQISSLGPPAAHLRDQFFVYAIPLGVAKKMASVSKLKVPSAGTNNVVYDSFYYYYYDDWNKWFDRTISAAHKAVSSSNDSGGSGGSFSSGGGGGGGGGGGRGAF